MEKYKYLSVLSFNRKENTAYVAESYRFKKHLSEVTLEDNWYNWSYPLDVIEELLGVIVKPDLIDIIFTVNATKLDKLMKDM